MQLKHRAALDNVQLDSVDNRIMIQKVETGDPKENITTVSLAGGSGSRVTNKHRDSIDITITFTVRCKKGEMGTREEVVEKANAWARNGGWFTTNYKNGRQIRVFLAEPAVHGDPWNWTQEYKIVLRACGVPYWQQSTAASVTGTGASQSLSLTVAGSAKSVLDFSFKNTSGSTVNTLSISTGESSMSFSNLALENNETLIIDHVDSGEKQYMRIRIKNTSSVYRSALDKRDTGSSNELTVSPGSRTIAITAGGAGSSEVKCYGRYA